jgi:serine/threonine-protein kinase PRP4
MFQPDPPRDLELEIPPSPPPLETTLAARRAKRLAIMAKYADLGANPDPEPSSAVQPPPPTTCLSNPESQSHSVAETPAIMSEVNVKTHRDVPSEYMRGFSGLMSS